MKDIKVRNKVITSSERISESFFSDSNNVVEKKEVTKEKSKISVFSSVLFGTLILSTSAYVFLVCSSVFFAVRESKFNYRTETLSASINTKKIEVDGLTKVDKNRVSYINLNSDTSLTIR